VRQQIIPVTREFLRNLPLGDDSPCKLTRQERASIVFYMSVETIGDIASCEPYMLVMTWKRRIGEWTAPSKFVLPKVDRFRFGPIAHAVVAHAKNELAELSKPDTPTE